MVDQVPTSPNQKLQTIQAKGEFQLLRDGKPVSRQGPPQFLKYIRLESYIEKTDNDALNGWFDKHGTNLRTGSDGFAVSTIYVNGDHNLNMLQPTYERWSAVTLDPIFKEKMFEGNEQ